MGVVLGRRLLAWQEDSQCRHCGRNHPEEHNLEPETTNEPPWDQGRLAKFGAIQKARELPKAILTSKDLSPKVTMSRGEIFLKNCFIQSLEFLVTWNFLQF